MASDVGPDLILFALALLPLWLLISPRLSIDVFRRIGPLGVAAISLGLVGWAAIDIRVFNVLWLSVRMTAPAVLIFGSMLLVPSRQAAHRSSVHRLRFVALVCTTAWCGLIQFPFTPPLYFCFIAPLAVLSIYAVVDNRGEPSINFALPAIFACAAVGFMARQALFVEYIPRVVLKNTSTALLDLPRGGLTVRKKDRDRYVLMADLVTRHAGSTFIYATPDSPEIYFLTERENPTRTFFEFFDDTAGRDGRTLATLRDRDVRLVIINRFPSTSPLISKSLYDSLMVRYPFQADLDVYEVRWRE